MIVLTNTVEQTVDSGQAIIFDETILHTGCGECHRKNTGSVKMRGNGIYNVFFAANVGGTTAATPVQLSIQIGGATLAETTRVSTPAAVGDLNPLATGTLVRNCCGDYDRLTVVNTGTVPIVVGANSVFEVRREG